MSHADVAAELAQLAAHLQDAPPLARDALQLAAALLQGDAGPAHYRLTMLLHAVEVGELLAAARLTLELEAAQGHGNAARASAHVQVAGAIYYGEADRRHLVA